MIKKIFLIISVVFMFSLVNVSASELVESEEMLLLDPAVEELASLDIRFLFCESSECSKEKKDFYVNEPFFISYKSNNKLPLRADISLVGDDFKDSILVPSYYQFKQVGAYEITFSADIEGFQSLDHKKLIEVKAIEGAEVCSIDGRCLNEETEQNCPQDCSVLQKEISREGFEEKSLISLFVAMFLLVLIIAVVVLFLYLKRRTNNKGKIDLADDGQGDKNVDDQ